MATANVTLPDGTTVTIDGTPEEVAILVERISRPGERFEQRRTTRSSTSGNRKTRSGHARTGAQGRSTSKGPADYIRELAASDFFATKRGIGEVQAKLEEQAHIYPVTHLSPVLFRLVKSKELRRIKDEGQWRYVNP
jgi:hypothetical protein